MYMKFIFHLKTDKKEGTEKTLEPEHFEIVPTSAPWGHPLLFCSSHLYPDILHNFILGMNVLILIQMTPQLLRRMLV